MLVNTLHKRGTRQAIASLLVRYAWSSVDAVDAVSEGIVHFGLQVGNFTDRSTGLPSYSELARYANGVDVSESDPNSYWKVNSVGSKLVRRARHRMA